MSGKRGGAADEETNGGADGGGAIHEADVHGGHAEEDGGAEGEELFGGAGGLEAFEQAEGHAGGEPAVDAVGEAMDMKKGEGEEETVAGGELPGGIEGSGVGGKVVVGEHGALGEAGGAGGVDEGGDIVRADGDVGAQGGESGGIGEERGQEGGIDEEAGGGVGEDVGELAVAIEDVDGEEDGAELEDSEEEVDEVRAIGEVDGDAVALGDATGGEGVGETVGSGVDFAKGKGLRAPLESGLGGASLKGDVEELDEIHSHPFPKKK